MTSARQWTRTTVYVLQDKKTKPLKYRKKFATGNTLIKEYCSVSRFEALVIILVIMGKCEDMPHKDET